MKKYIIKGTYRSEYSNMKTEFNSRKDAINAIIDYIYNYNKNLNDDDNLMTPFDFIIKEVDVKDVNEIITDFESARKALVLKPNDYTLFEHLPKFIARFISDINPKHIDALIALNRLFTIAEAWNEEDEFVPNFLNKKQDKWFPFFKYNNSVARFVLAGSNCSPMFAIVNAHIGSRLCFKTSKRAEQFGKQFEDLYNEVLL